MPNVTAWATVGCFGRPHGVKGWICVHSFTNPRDKLLEYSDWHMEKQGQWILFKPKEILIHSKAVIVLLDGYSNREDVAQLTNCPIAIAREQLPALTAGEYYWHELIGLKVVNQDNQVLGLVDDLLATGSNDVLVVVGDQRHLIPYLPGDFVHQVDLARGEMRVEWDVDF